MEILEILQIAILVITAGIGLIGLALPGSITGFTGLMPDGVRGISEQRSIFGGLFIALGVAPLVLDTPRRTRSSGSATWRSPPPARSRSCTTSPTPGRTS